MKTFAYLRAQTADQAPHLLASQLKNYSESYSENHLEARLPYVSIVPQS